MSNSDAAITEIDSEVNKLLTQYDSGNINIVGDQCPIFFSQMKNKFLTFSNSGKDKVRQYLINKITLEKQKLIEKNPNDLRIEKLNYFLDKMCKCTGACKDTLQETNFINKPQKSSFFSFYSGNKGGKRKTHKRRRRHTKKNTKKYKTKRRR